MASFDSKKAPPRELTTVEGVQITVDMDDDPPPEPAPDSEPWYRDEEPSTFVIPLGQSPEDRDAFMKSLSEAYGPVIDELLRERKDVLPESAKDLAQNVILVLAKRMHEDEPLRNVRAFLRRTIRYVANDHKKEWRPDVDRGADMCAEISPDLDPEQAAAQNEEWKRLAVYVDRLSPEERNAFNAIEGEGLSFKEAAEALGVPVGTVVTRHARAERKLAEFARESDREAEAGLRVRPPPRR
jgi:RNA polymerase sigma-70 factor (ECF subfamily)